MGRCSALVLVCVATSAVGGWRVPAAAHTQEASPLSGSWTLNRSLSEFPQEMGFNPDWIAAVGAGQSAGTSSGGRGRRGSSGAGARGSAGPFSARRESYDDGQRLQLLTAEARNPPARLVLVDTPAAVTITNELGQSRTFHPDGKDESIQIQGVTIAVTSKHEGNRLVIVYHVEQDRDLRYSYSYSTNPVRLVVELQFLDHGAGDTATRVYDPGGGTDAVATPRRAGTPAAASQQEPQPFDQRPGAELKGLTSLGILVEDLGAQALACGLSHDAIEAALSKRLTDGGFTVHKNSDEDTYVYVNVITTSVANGICVSRYDAFLYTHATARLAYRDQPVLVQVSLMHRGGIGSSVVSTHAPAVSRGLEGYIDLFVTQIHDANK